MRLIPLSRGLYSLVDDADYPRLAPHRWHALLSRSGQFYAARYDGPKYVYMHRVILGAKAGALVDHANRDSLDNRRTNLRPADKSRNAVNAKLLCKSASGYRGVFRKRKAFTARLVVRTQLHELGVFTDPLEAARAYDTAALHHFGEFARLNFPTTTEVA